MTWLGLRRAQPEILPSASTQYATRMEPTERPDVGYAMIFPSMTIVKFIAVQMGFYEAFSGAAAKPASRRVCARIARGLNPSCTSSREPPDDEQQSSELRRFYEPQHLFQPSCVPPGEVTCPDWRYERRASWCPGFSLSLLIG